MDHSNFFRISSVCYVFQKVFGEGLYLPTIKFNIGRH